MTPVNGKFSAIFFIPMHLSTQPGQAKTSSRISSRDGQHYTQDPRVFNRHRGRWEKSSGRDESHYVSRKGLSCPRRLSWWIRSRTVGSSAMKKRKIHSYRFYMFCMLFFLKKRWKMGHTLCASLLCTKKTVDPRHIADRIRGKEHDELLRQDV